MSLLLFFKGIPGLGVYFQRPDRLRTAFVDAEVRVAHV